MKAQELRIGNYVKLFLNHEDYDVIQIKIDDLYYINQKNGIYEPIPLTEEWLEKFGFSSKDYKKGYIGIDHKAGGMITDFVLTYPYHIGEHQKYFIWEHSKWKYNTLEYVHQLQNLFFTLTGEELGLQNNL